MSTVSPPQGYQTNPLVLRETALAGAATLETGELLTKDVAGRTEFFYEDDLGVQIQLTSAGGINMAAASGVLGITHGGTGLNAAGAANTVLGVVGAGGSLEYKAITAGTNMAVVHAAGTITLNGSQTPTITSFVNAGHTHVDAAGGGQLTDAALSAAVGLGKGGSGLTTTGTANQFLGMVAVPGGMEWKSFAAGAGISITHAAGLVTITNTSPGVTDHGALTGLVPDDDHTQYALLAGRTGGQTLYGGTGAADPLTLSATSNGTPGEIRFCNTGTTVAARFLATGEFIWGGTAVTATGELFSIQKNQNAGTYLKISNTNTGNAASSLLIAGSSTASITMGAWSPGWASIYANACRIDGQGCSALEVATDNSSPVIISPNGTRRWYFFPDGTLGIGITGSWGAAYMLQIFTAVSGHQNSWVKNTTDHTQARSSITSYCGTTTQNESDLFATSDSFTPTGGMLAADSGVRTATSDYLSLVAAASIPIRIVTNSTERARFLATTNVLQGNAGFTLQGGAEASNALTLSSTAHGTKGAINVGESGCTIGFYGVTAAARATAYTQTYSTASKTHANLTTSDLDATATTQTTPWGFATQAQGDAIATKVNLLIDDVENAKQVLNQVIDDLQAVGLLQ